MASATEYLTVRLAALVIVYDGRLPAYKAKNMAVRSGLTGTLSTQTKADGHTHSRGTLASHMIRRASRELIDEGLLAREGDEFVAPSLPELAAWLAEVIDDDYDPSEVQPAAQTIARRSEPKALYRQAGGDPDRFAKLMADHGHDLGAWIAERDQRRES